MEAGGATPGRAARAARSLCAARPLPGERLGGGRASAPGRTSSRTRGAAARGARHAHGGRRAGVGLPRRRAAGRPHDERSPATASSRSIIPTTRSACRFLRRPTPTMSLADLASLGPRARAAAAGRRSDGELREPFPRLGAVAVDDPSPRRRRRSVLKRRRPSILMRRKPGAHLDEARPSIAASARSSRGIKARSSSAPFAIASRDHPREQDQVRHRGST